MGDAELIVVENSKDVHNIIVCTLCSCYPRTVLGLPPDWYKSRNYRSRVVVEPRAVLEEFGTELPDEVTLRAHDFNADLRYLVLPERPAGTEGWSQDQLAALVTRDCMVGVAFPKVGYAPSRFGCFNGHATAKPAIAGEPHGRPRPLRRRRHHQSARASSWCSPFASEGTACSPA